MTAGVFLLAAGAAVASGFDFESPAFWAKGYSIPDAYCQTEILATNPDSSRLSSAAAPCQFSIDPAGRTGGLAHCHLPDAQCAALLSRLRKAAAWVEVSSSCAPVPDFPELYFKRDALTREAASIAESSATVPGTWGLLEAQQGTLKELIASYESAKIPVMEVVLALSSSSASLAAARGSAVALRAAAVQREHPPHAHWIYHWARVPSTASEQVPVVFVEIAATTTSSRGKSVMRSLEKIGERYVEPGSRFVGRQMYLVDRLDVRVFRRLAAMDGFVALRRSPRMRYHEDLADDERYDILARELRDSASLFERVPHIRAFVRGELERIRDVAERLRRLQGKTLVVVEVKDPSSLDHR